MKYPIQIVLAFTACILSGVIGYILAQEQTVNRALEVLHSKSECLDSEDLFYVSTGEKP